MNKIQGLLNWCKYQLDGYPNVPISNFTTSWRNGLAFNALIHKFKPELINFHELEPENVIYNNYIAFKTAEDHLSIPSLLDPKDLSSMDCPERLSIITYVSQFYNCLKNMKPEGGYNINKFENSNNDNSDIELITSRASVSRLTRLKCVICKTKVYLLERYVAGDKLYHRQCYRNVQIQNIDNDSEIIDDYLNIYGELKPTMKKDIYVHPFQCLLIRNDTVDIKTTSPVDITEESASDIDECKKLSESLSSYSSIENISGENSNFSSDDDIIMSDQESDLSYKGNQFFNNVPVENEMVIDEYNKESVLDKNSNIDKNYQNQIRIICDKNDESNDKMRSEYENETRNYKHQKDLDTLPQEFSICEKKVLKEEYNFIRDSSYKRETFQDELPEVLKQFQDEQSYETKVQVELETDDIKQINLSKKYDYQKYEKGHICMSDETELEKVSKCLQISKDVEESILKPTIQHNLNYTGMLKKENGVEQISTKFQNENVSQNENCERFSCQENLVEIINKSSSIKATKKRLYIKKRDKELPYSTFFEFSDDEFISLKSQNIGSEIFSEVPNSEIHSDKNTSQVRHNISATSTPVVLNQPVYQKDTKSVSFANLERTVIEIEPEDIFDSDVSSIEEQPYQSIKPQLSRNSIWRKPIISSIQSKQRQSVSIPIEGQFRDYAVFKDKLEELNMKQSDIEIRARKIQQRLGEENTNSVEYESLLEKWLGLVEEKDKIFYEENSLYSWIKDLKLQTVKMKLEAQIRLLSTSGLNDETFKQKEKELVGKLIETVNQRSELVEAMDKENIRRIESLRLRSEALEQEGTQKIKSSNSKQKSKPVNSSKLRKKFWKRKMTSFV